MALLFVALAYNASTAIGGHGMGFFILQLPWSISFITDAATTSIQTGNRTWYAAAEWLFIAINAFILYCIFGGLRPHKKSTR